MPLDRKMSLRGEPDHERRESRDETGDNNNHHLDVLVGQKRILVVDDEEVLRGLLADILTCDGHQVDTACDGLEALDWLDQHHYDAVFTDLQMPGLDGPRLYEAVQKRQGEDPPRVIFMTGNAALSADFLRDTREPILEKPFSLDAARGVVKALFRER